jgi:hypothetical protein
MNWKKAKRVIARTSRKRNRKPRKIALARSLMGNLIAVMTNYDNN